MPTSLTLPPPFLLAPPFLYPNSQLELAGTAPEAASKGMKQGGFPGRILKVPKAI